jgi:hypothetical protein
MTPSPPLGRALGNEAPELCTFDLSSTDGDPSGSRETQIYLHVVGMRIPTT